MRNQTQLFLMIINKKRKQLKLEQIEMHKYQLFWYYDNYHPKQLIFCYLYLFKYQLFWHCDNYDPKQLIFGYLNLYNISQFIYYLNINDKLRKHIVFDLNLRFYDTMELKQIETLIIPLYFYLF